MSFWKTRTTRRPKCFTQSGVFRVIVGGESGPRARPIRPEWVREIRDRCEAARVAFFFKQWGGVRKHATGRELDGEYHDGFPPSRQGGVPVPATS